MKKIKLTCAHAIIKHLIAQKILIDGKKEQLFAGAFGIFGHGNVACLGQALQENQDKLPTYSCLLYTSPSPRDVEESRMPSSA